MAESLTGGARGGAAALRLSGPAPVAILHLAGPAKADPSLLAVGRSAQGETGSLLGVAPGRWWLVRDLPAPDAPGVPQGSWAATDIGDAWLRYRIEGQASPDLLAKGSALDLDRRVFPAGACAFAVFAQLRCLLHRTGEDRFDLYCQRSYAHSLGDWLSEASAEFCCDTKLARGGAAQVDVT